VKGSLGDYDAAIRYASEASESEPTNTRAKMILSMANSAIADLLCDKGEAMLLEVEPAKATATEHVEQTRNNREDIAREVFQAAIEQDPASARAHYLLGNVHEIKGDFSEAIEEQQLAVHYGERNVFGGYAEAHFALGVALEAQKRSYEAVEHYEQATRLLPLRGGLRIDVQLCLADALTTLAPTCNGSSVLDSNITIGAKNEDLGSKLTFTAALDRAEVIYTTVVETASIALEQAHAAFGLGSVHRQRGVNLQAAVKAFQKATDLDSSNAQYWCNLGYAAESLARRVASGRISRASIDE
jgi:tetratricopeptide (TPR) repeat protein